MRGIFLPLKWDRPCNPFYFARDFGIPNMFFPAHSSFGIMIRIVGTKYFYLVMKLCLPLEHNTFLAFLLKAGPVDIFSEAQLKYVFFPYSIGASHLCLPSVWKEMSLSDRFSATMSCRHIFRSLEFAKSPVASRFYDNLNEYALILN